MSGDALAKALSALARFQITELSVGDTLHRLADVTVEAIPGAEVAGMTMLGQDGRPTTAVYTDEDSPEIDEGQYREGKGPCLDAWRENRVVRIDQIADEASRYPHFVAACQEHGVQSTLSIPMVSGDVALGALNLYARSPRAFTAEDERSGSELAAASGSVLGNVSAYWTAFDLGVGLREAMKTRAVIEQAKGMLMARAPFPDADEAFELLVKASQRENVKLRAIAQRIVEQARTRTP